MIQYPAASEKDMESNHDEALLEIILWIYGPVNPPGQDKSGDEQQSTRGLEETPPAHAPDIRDQSTPGIEVPVSEMRESTPALEETPPASIMEISPSNPGGMLVTYAETVSH